MTPAPPSIDIAKRVDQYIRLRDKIKEIQKRQKEELTPYLDALDRLNTMLVDHLTTVGSDSATVNGVGTVYKNPRKSATIADGSEFKRHVIGAGAWDLADWKANAIAVEAFINEHGEPPPGVNYNVTIVAGVRRG